MALWVCLVCEWTVSDADVGQDRIDGHDEECRRMWLWFTKNHMVKAMCFTADISHR